MKKSRFLGFSQKTWEYICTLLETDELMVNILLNTKYLTLGTLFPANLLASTKKTKSKPGETSTQIET